MYLLISSVRLLRRFVIDHSAHLANETVAWLHIIMISVFFTAAMVNNFTFMYAHVETLNSSKQMSDYTNLIMFGKLVK